MNLEEIIRAFWSGLRQTGPLEAVAVVAGIWSVWLSRKENILVYPVGLVNTIGFIYLSLEAHLVGEASVNFYYTVMSIYGWVLWSRRDEQKKTILAVTFSSKREWIAHLSFFSVVYLVIYVCLVYLRKAFAPGAIPPADAFASATAYTGMLLMARKKVESWIWWILTNIASIPLYFIKGFVFTSFQFVVLLAMAFWGWSEWRKKAINGG